MKILHVILTFIALYLSACSKHVDEPIEPQDTRAVWVCDEWAENGVIVRRRNGVLDTLPVSHAVKVGKLPLTGGPIPQVKTCLESHFEIVLR